MRTPVAAVALFALWLPHQTSAATLRLAGAANHGRVAMAHANTTSTNVSGEKALPNFAIIADQCKCTFSGLCNCSAAVEFMTCVNDACVSGDCDCTAWHFIDSCNKIAGACPTVGLSCSHEQATCTHGPIAGPVTDASDPQLLQQLAHLRHRKCKLQHAVQVGYLNAQDRLDEVSLEIQGRLDVLKARGAAAPPYMGCPEGSVPPVGMEVSWVGGEAVLTTTIAALPAPSLVPAVPAVPALAAPVPTMSPLEQKEENRLWHVFVNISVYILFVLLVAFIYDKYRLGMSFPQKSGQDVPDAFSHSLFACFQDPKLSLLAFCCPLVRWADTMDKANELEDQQGGSAKETMIQYWPGVVLAATLMALQLYVGAAALFPFASWIFGGALLFIVVQYRQRLRRRINIDAGSIRSFAEDGLTWLCCPCCAVVQEAREVEQDLAHHQEEQQQQ